MSPVSEKSTRGSGVGAIAWVLASWTMIRTSLQGTSCLQMAWIPCIESVWLGVLKAVHVAESLQEDLYNLSFSLKQTTDLNLPPEDLDSSGDDDNFSGSGAGPLSHSVEAIIPVGPTNSSIDVDKLQTTVHYLHETGSPADEEVVAPSSSSDVVTDEPEADVQDETTYELVTFSAGAREEVITTNPATPSPSVKVTTSQVSSTADAVEPAIHSLDVVDFAEKEHDPIFTPASKEDVTTAAVHTATTLRTSIPAHEDGEIVTSEDGSGDVGDFFISRNDEKLVDSDRNTDVDSERNSKAAGALGIMDRKEVLGGVIAGGLVGLLFAVFLVGFMLYRMKKKDEGSYSLDEPKQSNGGYQKPHKQEEFYA
ncbi:PREDICTED: syndecan-1 [Gavialis gangeticus]|uniref:syndecan-1 n=1 Tax=Gavialis gangeticus TaxID=94835 RepID=UPI00092F160D|nr:PREDICTED: syndecan-1 [Gavialis gangeticus]